MKAQLVQAVNEHRIISFVYQGGKRIVEPHTYGIHKDTDNEVLSAFQIGGFSSSEKKTGWRLFEVGEMRSLVVSDEQYQRLRPGYKPRDSRMSRIFAKA